MADYQALKTRLQELAGRKWVLPAIEAKCKIIAAEEFTRETLDRDANRTRRL